MSTQLYDNLNEAQKGAFFVITGLIVLAYVAGFLKATLNPVMLICGIYMIFIGIIKLNYHRKIVAFIQSYRSSK